jgi:hypothetical protein
MQIHRGKYSITPACLHSLKVAGGTISLETCDRNFKIPCSLILLGYTRFWPKADMLTTKNNRPMTRKHAYHQGYWLAIFDWNKRGF